MLYCSTLYPREDTPPTIVLSSSSSTQGQASGIEHGLRPQVFSTQLTAISSRILIPQPSADKSEQAPCCRPCSIFRVRNFTYGTIPHWSSLLLGRPFGEGILLKDFMKKLIGFTLAGLVASVTASVSYGQGGDNAGRFSTPAYSGTDYSTAIFAQASGAPASGGAAPASGASRTAITPGTGSTAIPQQNNGTALTPGSPAITPGVNTAITPGVNTAIMPPTNNTAAGAVTNGIVPQGTGTIGQQGNTAIGAQGTTSIGQQGIANPGAQGRSSGATTTGPNGLIVNPDGSVTAVGGTAATALGATNVGAAAGGGVSTNGSVLQTNTFRPRTP